MATDVRNCRVHLFYTIAMLITMSGLLIPVTSYYSEDLSLTEAFAPPKDYHHLPQNQENEQEQEQTESHHQRSSSSSSNHHYQGGVHETRQQPHHHYQHNSNQNQHHSHHYHPHHNHQSHHHHNHNFHHTQQQQQQQQQNGEYRQKDDIPVGNAAEPAENLSQEQQQHDGPYYSNHIATNKYGQGHIGNCRLPDSWKGKWFQSGIQNPISIDSKFIEGKGTCYESSGDKFLFVEKKTCHRCVVINERHRNVLEYKESSFCEEKDTLENLCSQIPGDAQLYSLFRIDAQPIDCPFKGPFMFSYNRGHGVCKSPMSRVDVCTEPSKLLLKYQACPDVPRTESTTEELQCLAEWRDSAYHYLVGKLNYQLAASNEDRYRCFIYEKSKGHIIKIAESGDATCIGLSSPTEGARTLTFQKIHESSTKCKFPSWVTLHQWHSLDGKLTVRTSHKNSSISVSSEDNKREQYYGIINHNNQFSSGIHGAYTGAYTGGPFGSTPIIKDTIHHLLTEGTRIQCQSRIDIDEDHVAITAHHTEGCTSSTVCMHLYRRDSHVIELQIREKGTGDFDDYDCGRPEAMGPNLPYVTLISSGENSRCCPYLGKYMTTTITQDGRLISTPAASSGDPCSTISSQSHGGSQASGGGGSGSGGGGAEASSISLTNAHHQGSFHSLVVGCGHRATMDFHTKCLPHEPITSYECHGSWEEGGLGFLIASPMSRSSTSARRYCFSYSETDEGLQVYSSSDSCLRDGSPNLEGIWAFNLTVDGQCAEPVTTGGVTRTISCDVVGSNYYSYPILLLLSTYFLQSSSLWMISSSGWMEQLRAVILTLLTSSIPHLAKEVAFAVLELLGGGVVTFVAFSSKTVPFLPLNPVFRTTHNQTHHHHQQEERSKSVTTAPRIAAPLMTYSTSSSTTCYTGGGGSPAEIHDVRE